jgi:hypothetical protein
LSNSHSLFDNQNSMFWTTVLWMFGGSDGITRKLLTNVIVSRILGFALAVPQNTTKTGCFFFASNYRLVITW